MEIQPIGIVRSSITQPVEEKWGDVVSEIHVDAAYVPGLQGIESWSHIVVVYHMHEAQFDLNADLVSRPRNRDDMPEVGVFAQRTRTRPNAIGVAAVEVLEVAAPILKVRRLDAIDGTPVLDIKPYASVYDTVSEPLIPIWFIRLMQGYF